MQAGGQVHSSGRKRRCQRSTERTLMGGKRATILCYSSSRMRQKRENRSRNRGKIALTRLARDR